MKMSPLKTPASGRAPKGSPSIAAKSDFCVSPSRGSRFQRISLARIALMAARSVEPGWVSNHPGFREKPSR